MYILKNLKTERNLKISKSVVRLRWRFKKTNDNILPVILNALFLKKEKIEENIEQAF